MTVADLIAHLQAMPDHSLPVLILMDSGDPKNPQFGNPTHVGLRVGHHLPAGGGTLKAARGTTPGMVVAIQ